MTNQKRKRLGDLLVEEGLIDRYQLQSALAEQRKWGGRLGKHLIDLGIIGEAVLIKALSKLLQMPSVDVGRLQIPRAIIDYVPVKTAERFNLIPINVIDPESNGSSRRTLVVAMSDPTNLAALDEVKFTSGCDVRAVVSGDLSIERAIKIHYHGADPEELESSVSRTPTPQGGVTDDHWEIVTSGEIRTLPTDTDATPTPTPQPSGPVPQSSPEDIASIGMGALQPVDPGEDPALLARRLNALLRILIKKRVLTPEELDAELEKG